MTDNCTRLASQPPTLPVPRHPSPLSLGIDPDDRLSYSNASSPVPSVFESEELTMETDAAYSSHVNANNRYRPGPSHRSVSAASTSTSTLDRERNSGFKVPLAQSRAERSIPIHPAPDSIVHRTTLKQLESQTVTLKRLSKTVLANLAIVTGIYEQLDRAEDELLGSLGELATWLGHGYGLKDGIWEEDKGVRKIKREKRRREKEDLEVMVQHGVENVRVELKRRGLAGGGATAKFEKAQQGYYNQTGAYLAPGAHSHTHHQAHAHAHHHAGSSAMAPSHSNAHLHTHPMNSSSSSGSSSSMTADRAHLAKTAQMDLKAYQHHSTLLYAVPPSSVSCLDLLVSLHSWAGSLLPPTDTLHNRRRSSDSTPRRLPDGLDTPVHILSRPDRAPSTLKDVLADSLAQMAVIREDLLHCWGLRNAQQHILESEVHRKQAEADGTWNVVDMPPTTPTPQSQPQSQSGTTGWTGPVSSAGIESKRPQRKMHKIHRSVGGKLRDLLSSSSSSHSLAMGVSDRGSRTSFDYGQPITRGVPRPRTESVPEHSIAVPVSASTPAISTPFPPMTTSATRPILATRHSVQLERGEAYVSPINRNAHAEVFASPDLGLGDRTEIFAGVGGFRGTGDEDEVREEVGRKNEGVLWTPGSWDALGKSSSKAKWEMAWVVLDHSKIYEYGGIDTTQLECQAAIDLKFASVREGRDTDRRFVFEVISAKEGRRLYQATSESDMRMWLCAIANAIESCINGTSSVRTFDTSKLRTTSGALDDHALPAVRHVKPLGLGFPLPSTPGNRRSMPPLSRNGSGSGHFMRDRGDRGGDRRIRKTSFKNVLKQSGEKWSSVMNGVTNRNSASFDLPRPASGVYHNGNGEMGPPPLPESMLPPVIIPRDPNRNREDIDDPSGQQPHLTTSTAAANATANGTSAMMSTSPSSKSMREWDEYDGSHDTAIEKRVFEMAGLGLGDSPRSSASLARRVQSEGGSKTLDVNANNHGEGTEMSRSRSADVPRPGRPMPEMTMKTLRELADNPTNAKCADCKKPTKASQWATLNLRGIPMVMFLCIRCCGLHRGLGTHISKPRGINLDHWSPDSIALAYEWGNQRGNEIWEKTKPASLVPSDENISGYIQAKYVEGRWLSSEDRGKFTWAEKVGRAI